MRYLALASDYDGTLAHDGRVTPRRWPPWSACAAPGGAILLVTGREIPDLLNTFDRADLFDLIVAENGALLYWPATKNEKVLAPAPPQKFIDALLARRVAPLSVGRVIVATWEPFEKAVLEAIHECGLELQVIFNKGSVMVLPSGVNKATGLAAGLTEMGMSTENVVGVGDAENDHAFLAACACGIAVSNALPALKERADFVTKEDHGKGVTELIDRLLANDLADVTPRPDRHTKPAS